MSHQGQMLRSSRRPLWECILDRHKYRSRLLRARVPLVFRRLSLPANFYQRPRLLTPIVQYPLNLHLQLSWPLLSVKETRFRETLRQSSVIRNHRQRTFDQPMPARGQLSSLINSYAIVTALRDQLHTASTVFKSAGRVPLPAAALDQSNHATVRSSLTHSDRKLNLPTQVEAGKTHAQAEAKTPAQVEPGKSSTQVESHQTHARAEDPARRTFPEVVITSRRLAVVREIVRPRSLTTASTPGSFRHQTPAALSTAVASGQTVGNSKSFSNIRRRESLSHPEVFRPNTDTEFAPVSTSAKTHYGPPAKTESTRGSFVPLEQRLYRQPASRDFASAPAHADEKQSVPQESQSSLPQRPAVPQPSIDIGQLSEEVYRHIQRKLRIERERRGL